MSRSTKPHVIANRTAEALGWAAPRNLARTPLLLALRRALGS